MKRDDEKISSNPIDVSLHESVDRDGRRTSKRNCDPDRQNEVDDDDEDLYFLFLH